MRGIRAGVLLWSVSCALVVAAVAAAPALALSPSVETLAATSVASTTATLNGKVNPNSLETKAYFEYGTTTSYGSKTAEVNVGAGGTTLERNEPISSLSPGTTYHFRIVATNSSGTSQGTDQTFTTTAPPWVGTWIAKMEDAGEAATLQAFVNPKGLSTTYQFEYGTESGVYTTTAPIPGESAGSGTESKPVSYKITGLTPNTKYYYRVSATNAAGTTYGGQLSFPYEGTPVISNVSSSGVRQQQATLSAVVEPGELATKYYFQYGLTTAYGSKTSVKEIAGGGGAKAIAETISGLSKKTTYHYRLVAENGSGIVVSPDQTFTTWGNATLYAGGVSIGTGYEIKAFSSNLTYSNGGSCAETEFKGELKENPGAWSSVNTTKMQNAGGAYCSWFAPYTVKFAIPKGITFGYGVNVAGEGIVETSNFVLAATVYYEKAFPVTTCEYNVALTDTFATGAAMKPTLTDGLEFIKGAGVCANLYYLSGDFAFTVLGTAVEAKP
ncbi:MAG TPA: hypothetical protein VFZ29_10975 [Solirubrobacterales bacterium]